MKLKLPLFFQQGDRSEWVNWYAWRPIIIETNTNFILVWLETIRRRELPAFEGGCYWDYETITEKEPK